MYTINHTHLSFLHIIHLIQSRNYYISFCKLAGGRADDGENEDEDDEDDADGDEVDDQAVSLG